MVDSAASNRARRLVAVAPGILTVEAEEVEHLAVDRGILVKCGPPVVLSVREEVRGQLDSLTLLLRAQQARRQQSEAASLVGAGSIGVRVDCFVR